MSLLTEKLKQEIVEQLNLTISAAEIDEHAPLFGAGLGLDSIDALELIVMIERNYGIKIKDQEQGKKAMSSIHSLAEFIEQNRG